MPNPDHVPGNPSTEDPRRALSETHQRPLATEEVHIRSPHWRLDQARVWAPIDGDCQARHPCPLNEVDLALFIPPNFGPGPDLTDDLRRDFVPRAD